MISRVSVQRDDAFLCLALKGRRIGETRRNVCLSGATCLRYRSLTNLGTIMVFDHDRSEIGQAVVTQASGNGKTTFAIPLPYSSSFQGETQEGVIALYAYTGNHIIAGVAMVKVLLSA